MLKYVDTKVTFAEIPDHITLCINISNCPCHCEGCHSSYLAKDIGDPLSKSSLKKLIERNKGISCVSFMGGDSSPTSIVALASWIKTNTNLKVAWYSGKQELNETVSHQLWCFDFIKLGPYLKECGPLNYRTTNQKFYKIVHLSSGVNKLYDITYKFWKENETEN